MYKLHCSKCDKVIEASEGFFKVSYTEFGVGTWAAAPRYCEVCAGCFNEFKRGIDWEIGKVEEVQAKPQVVGSFVEAKDCGCN